MRALAVAAALAIAACTPDSKPMEQSPAGLDQSRLVIDSANGPHEFVVEIARTPEQQAYGLMNRQSMDPDRGMLFPYDPPRAVAFWMRDTLIPLDLIFVAPGGTIRHIAADAVPYAEDQLYSGGEVESVVELNGGRAAQLGIAVGDRVRLLP